VSLLGVRKGTTPRAGLCLGRGCFTRGEGGVRDGPLASAGGRPLHWGRSGCAGVRGRGWLLGRARLSAGFQPTVSLVFKIPFFSKSVYNLQNNLNSIQI
jgi:hypothetical protein